MTDKEASEMITRVIEEITGLRREIEALRPQAEAYQAITSILGLLPRSSRGATEDIVWRLRAKLEELKPDKPAAATA